MAFNAEVAAPGVCSIRSIKGKGDTVLVRNVFGKRKAKYILEVDNFVRGNVSKIRSSVIDGNIHICTGKVKCNIFASIRTKIF